MPGRGLVSIRLRVVRLKTTQHKKVWIMGKLELKPINKAIMSFTIKGTSPLITHNWDEKAKEMMRQKQQEQKKTKGRDKRDPQRECMAAAYRTDGGQFGVPGLALKTAIITAAHKDIGIEKTLVRKALFLRTTDSNKVIAMQCGEPEMREDMVRVGMGSADLRYRPMWKDWAVDVEFEVDMDLLQENDVIALVDRAGFGVGICEWRPEKNGEFGRFEIDKTKPFLVEVVK